MTAQRWRREIARGGILLLAACGLYLLLLVLNISLAGQIDERGPADVIIVLGAAQYDGQPSPVYRARLDHAVMLYRQGYARQMLFTGGKRRGDRFTEAEAGRAYARAQGVPDAAILLERRGKTTWQSLHDAADIMRTHGLRRAILVSDPFHAYRLRRMAHDLGIEALVSPATHSRVRSSRVKARYILRETAVYIVYRMTGT